MAFTTIYLKHPDSEDSEKAPIGFSWTVLFLGGFPILFRGDLKNFSICFVVAILSFILDSIGLSSIIFIPFWLFYAFNYNKMFVKRLVSKGFLVKESPDFPIKELEEKLEMKLPTAKK